VPADGDAPRRRRSLDKGRMESFSDGVFGFAATLLVLDIALHLCVPKTSSKSCDQAIFADQAINASVSSDAIPLKIDRFGQRFQRRGAVQ